MGRSSRPKPQKLAEKLKQIRLYLSFSQTEMLINLNYDVNKKELRSVISAYELGKREPTLLDLLIYARLVKVPVENLIDDQKDLFNK